LRVLKIEAEGLITSFRYPHFMQSIHPSFEMPPPATIYGHICSALGEWVPPEEIWFAYKFTYRSKVTDVEHIHVLTPSSGQLKHTGDPKTLSGIINPFQRTLLFEPRLTLYINKPEWEKAFYSPHYPVVLGRSQDLFIYSHISIVKLERSEHAYFEHTLAPYSMLVQVGKGIIELMPRFLNYNNNREPVFARYLVINKRVKSTDFIKYSPEQYFWIDPHSPEYDGLHFGLLFHSFVGEDSESIQIS